MIKEKQRFTNEKKTINFCNLFTQKTICNCHRIGTFSKLLFSINIYINIYLYIHICEYTVETSTKSKKRNSS